MLDARMDRQKFSKMMERSDFMNLGAKEGTQWAQTEKLAAPPTLGWLDTSFPTPIPHHPTYLQKAA